MIFLKSKSIWEDTVETINYPKLNKNQVVDVLIIGGGISGISSLYHLKDEKLKVMLVEQNKLGFSITGKSTGKLSFLQNDLLDKIRFGLGNNVLKMYLKSQKDAINLIINTIKSEKINCDLEKVDSHLYTNKDNEIIKLRDLETFLESNNIQCLKDFNSIVNSRYMFKVNNTYNFHPLKFIYGLLTKSDYNIYEHTRIVEIKKQNDKYLCFTDDNKIIKTKYVIIASHYPYFMIPYWFPIKASLEKSYISCSRYKGTKVSLISYSKPFISIRNYKDTLIYLSNSHSIDEDGCDRKHFNELLKKVKDLNLKPDYLWSNIDIITNDGLPYIGRIKDNLFIATGYNTWGLATGFLSGKIIKDLILKQDNEYIKLFNPMRINNKQFINSFQNIFKTINGLITGLINKNDLSLKCPHIGCNLIYNEVENTYDCPCHGSRFDKNGKCISGPANKDLNIKTD